MSENNLALQSAPPPEEENEKKMIPTVQDNLPENDQSASENESGMIAANILDLPQENRPKYSNIYSDIRIVSIDARPTVATDADRQMNYLLDLIESLRSTKILSGKIEGVESSESGAPSVILYHGEFKIIIPSFEAIDPPADYRGQDPNDVLRYLLSKRLGAEINYVVKGIDQESGVAIASRLEAMAIKRRQFYFGKDRNGDNLLYEGAFAEVRVLSVIRTGIFAELFGVEVFISSQELSYQRIIDATVKYQPGMRLLAKIMKLDRTDPQNIRVAVSVKQARSDPYAALRQKYIVGNYYVGTVTVIDVNGIFVSLDGGVDCLCRFPIRGRPLVGSRVTVRIGHVSHDLKRLSGDIVHSSLVIE